MRRLTQALMVLFLVSIVPADVTAQTSIELVTIATGLSDPTDIAHAGDGSGRLFIVEQPGTIRIFDGSALLPNPFLDISGQVSCCNERGLLGLAFHPDYSSNGYFYVNYTNNSGDTRISRFSVDEFNPDLADPSSQVILLTIDQPNSNHNGGNLEFGPDGYLYIGMGDGGSSGDPDDRAQNPQDLLGKMLRIDVDGVLPYDIPPDNPFVGDPTTLDEIWALGVRNPWRFSFDRLTGDLWIADVGQNSREEVNFQAADSGGGENYGWRCYEGSIPFNLADCGPATDYDFPVFDYTHGEGCSITGGFVYRGSQYPDLFGHYLFIDYCSGNLWSTVPAGGGSWNTNPLNPASLGFGYTTFGEDEAGELYLGNANGTISRIASPCTLELSAALEAGTLNMNFTLGSLDPVTWRMFILARGRPRPVWAVPLPATDPPVAIPISIPGFPPLGPVVLVTALTTAEGPVCSAVAIVDTGTAASTPSGRELDDLFDRYGP